MCLVVTGKLPTLDLLSTVDAKIEPRIALHQQNRGPTGPPEWKRPFHETPSGMVPVKLEENKVSVIEFPEKDESQGELIISYVGPKSDDFLTCGVSLKHETLHSLAD